MAASSPDRSIDTLDETQVTSSGNCPWGTSSALGPPERTLRNRVVMFGDICLVTRTGPPDYVGYMLSTLLIIGGVLVGLLVLLAVIVSLSARPATAGRKGQRSGRSASWAQDSGRPHPDAWSPLSGTTNELPAIR